MSRVRKIAKTNKRKPAIGRLSSVTLRGGWVGVHACVCPHALMCASRSCGTPFTFFTVQESMVVRRRYNAAFLATELLAFTLHQEKRYNAKGVRLVITINHGILDHDTIVFQSHSEEFVRMGKETIEHLIAHIDKEEEMNRIVHGQSVWLIRIISGYIYNIYI